MSIILLKLLLCFSKLSITNNYLSFNNKFKFLSKLIKSFSSLSIVNLVLQQALLFLLNKNLILFQLATY